MRKKILALVLVATFVIQSLAGIAPLQLSAQEETLDTLYLCEMDWESATNPGWGSVNKHKDMDGNTASIQGVTYEHVIGTHTINNGDENQDIVYNIEGLGFNFFETLVGIGNNAGSKVKFSILVDDTEKISYTATGGESAKQLSVSVKGAKKLTLRVNCTDDWYNNDSSIWANPILRKDAPNEVSFSEMNWESATNLYAGPIKNAAWNNATVSVAGSTYEKAIGLHPIADHTSNGDIVYNVKDMTELGYTYFETLVGITDGTSNNKVVFSVLVDGVEKISFTAINQEPVKKLIVPIEGAEKITLRVNCDMDGNACDGSAWINPILKKQLADEIYLSDLAWESAVAAGYGTLQRDRTVEGQTAKIAEATYQHAIGTHGINDINQNQDIVYDLDGMGYTKLEAMVGIQNQGTQDFANKVKFSILADDNVVAEYVATAYEDAKKITANIEGAKKVTLRLNCSDDAHAFDNAIWANPMIYRESDTQEDAEVYLSDMDWKEASNLYAGPIKNAAWNSVQAQVAGTVYEKAIGVHPIADMTVNGTVVYDIEELTGAGFAYFETLVGVTDGTDHNRVIFSVYVDGVEKIRYTAKNQEPAKKLIVPIAGAKEISLCINCADDGHGCDGSAWLNPKLIKSLPDEIYASDYAWKSATEPLFWGTLHRDWDPSGNTAIINETPYEHAIGTHAFFTTEENHDIEIDISGLGYKEFTTDVGSPNQNEPNRVKFSILVDGEEKANCVTIGTFDAQKLKVDVEGANTITLRVNCDSDGNGFDTAIWGNPKFSRTKTEDEQPERDYIYLSEIDWTSETNSAGFGTIGKDVTVDGQIPKIAGVIYEKAIGTHAINDIEQHQDIVYDIEDLGYTWFDTLVGIQDQEFDFLNHVRFSVLVDGVEVTKRLATAEQEAQQIYVNIEGAKKLTLRVNCTADAHAFDNAIWAMPRLSKTAPEIEPVDMPDVLDLTEIDWVYAEAGWGEAKKNQNCEGGPLKILNTTYEKGLGTHAFATDYPADFIYDIAGMGYQYFTADVGADALGPGTVKFEVVGDGSVLASSPILGGSDEPYHLSVNIANVKELILRVYNADGTYNFDRANWGAPMLYKNASLMPSELQVNQLYNGKKVFTDKLDISGTSTGITGLKVYVDGELQQDILINDIEWKTQVTITELGKHTIKIEGLKEGQSVAAKEYIIEKVAFVEQDTVSLKSKSTEMVIARMDGMLAVKSLMDLEDGYEWLAETNEVHLPEDITIDGQDIKVQWVYKNKSDQTEEGVRTVTFHFVCEEYDLTLDSIWTVYPNAEAPVRHALDMWNNGEKEITVYSVPTLALDLIGKENENLELMTITKGAHSPDGVGVFYYDIVSGMQKNVFTATDYRIADSEQGYIPFSGIHGKNHGIYTGLEWPQGRILTEGGTRQENCQNFTVTNGLNDDFYTIIPSDMNYAIPAAFIGAYTGSRDDGSNEMTRWYADYMMQESVRENDKYPMLQYSYWWSTARTRLEWISQDKNFFKGVEQLAELGFDAGVLDVGWSTTPGTFTADPIRWSGGLRKHADYTHDLGMEFGVYYRPIDGMSSVEGSLTTMEGVGDMEWFATDSGERTIDLGNDEAKEVLLNGWRKLISESGMDILRVDFGGIITKSVRTNRHSNDTDVTYWTARGWYDVIGTLLEEFPNLKWESVNCGGSYKDFMSMQYASHIQSTDNFMEVPQRQTFYDASYVLPAQQIMQWFSDLIFSTRTTENYDYLFRSNLYGWAGFLVELPGDMVPEEYESFARTAEIYKEWMKPLVKYGKIYHVLPRPNGIDWDGMQYFDSDTGKGALLVFKCTTDENTKTVKLDGLEPTKTYHIWSEDRTIPYAKVSGEELMNTGVTFTLDGDYQSEILYIQEVGKDDAELVAPGSFAAESAATLEVDASEAVTVEWKKAELAETYTVTLYDANQSIAGQITTAETKTSFRGLDAGETYTWAVTANNAFGKTGMSGNPQIITEGTEILEKLANLILDEQIVRGNIESDNVVYLDSLIFETDDAVLSTNQNKIAKASLNPDAGYKTLTGMLTLANWETGMQAEVTLSTDLGKSKTFLLNENDKDRMISLDVENASEITLTIKNTSQDILKQTTRLLNVYSDGNNPYKYYYRVLHNKALENYVFAADVKHDIMGVIDATPRYGIFAGYTDENNLVGAYLDYQYGLFTTVTRVNGENIGVNHIPLAKDFDFGVYHTITAYREGKTFKIYLDGELMDVCTADIGAAKPGLSDNDTWATYKNITLEGQEFCAETPVGGIWNGLSPQVILNSASLCEQEIVIEEEEPNQLAKDEIIEIDKSAVIEGEEESEPNKIITFDSETDETLFKYYFSENNGWKVEREALVSGTNGEHKAILKEPICIEDGMIQADISVAESGGKLNAGLYINASNVRNGQDAITGLNIQLESDEGSRNLSVNIFKFDQGYGGKLASTTLSNFFADGDAKAPVNVKAVFKDGLLSVYVDNELQIPLMNIPLEGWEDGAVGLRSQEAGTIFDNIRVSATKLGTPQEPDIPNISDEGSKQKGYTFNSIWDALDFDFYHSSNGGFTIRDGKLIPSGDEGEFKAVLRGDNRAYKSVSVDIYPGADGTINSGLYIGANGAGHAVDKINALGILVQSDFEGWDDAANRIDIIIGEFPEWKELSRTISETGKKNELFSNGVKEPLNLRVDIDGNKVIVTLSLLNDPSMYVQTVYEYTGELDLEHGAVGVRSMFDDCSFDNFKVSYAESTGGNTTANGNVSNIESGKGTTGSANTGDPWTTTLSVLSVTTIVSLGVILFLLGKKKKEQF